jgi:Tol biopolymer transport system component
VQSPPATSRSGTASARAPAAEQPPAQPQPLAIASSNASAAGPPPAQAQPFAIAKGNAPDLWQVRERRGKLRRIAHRSSMHYAFSPDSSQVVFLSSAEGMVAMRPDGKNKRILASGPPNIAAPPLDADALDYPDRRQIHGTKRPAQPLAPLFFRFTPDARSVVYAAREAAGVGLFVVPLSGGSPRRLADAGSAEIGSMAITPDSRWVLLSRMAQGVDVIPLDGKPISRSLLGPHPLGMIYHITPDSRRVVYRGSQHVHSIDLDGTNDRDLTPGLDRTDSLFLVAGGVIVSEDRASIRYAALDGSGTRQLMPPGLSYSWPPEPVAQGKGLAFHDTQFNLYHVDLSSGVYRRINRPLDPGEQASPFYESTSDAIVYAVIRGTDQRSRSYELYVADLKTSVSRLLAVADRIQTFIARPTADQRYIIIHLHNDDDRMAFFRIDLETGDASRLTPFLPGWSNFEISPDSRYILFGITTKETQPRELDLHTLQLPPRQAPHT